jgi:hypothetical protein
LHDTRNSLTTFLPNRGIVETGSGLARLYPQDRNNFGPRIGFAYRPSPNGRTVIRGPYGIFYDIFQATYFVSNSIGNGGASGVNANPGARDPVYTLTRSNFTMALGDPVFGGVSPVPPYGVYSISQDLRLPYVQNFHFTVQRELTPGACSTGRLRSERGQEAAAHVKYQRPRSRDNGKHAIAASLCTTVSVTRINQRATNGRKFHLSLFAGNVQRQWLEGADGTGQLHVFEVDRHWL